MRARRWFTVDGKRPVSNAKDFSMKDVRIWLNPLEDRFCQFFSTNSVTNVFFLRLTKCQGIFPYFMSRNPLAIGTPLLLALILVSAVSLSARIYRDHGLTQKVQADATHTDMVIVQGK